MVNGKYPVKLTFVNNNHARSELCRLNQHLGSFLNNVQLLVNSLSRRLQRARHRLFTSSIETAPKHGARDAIDTQHQRSHSHIHLLFLAHMKDFVKSPDQDVSQFLIYLLFGPKEIL
jgi:hypothetical protein